MKTKTAVALIVIITLALVFIQDNIVQQVAVWLAGIFGLLAALALKTTGNEPAAEQKKVQLSDAEVLFIVKQFRRMRWTDLEISVSFGIDIDVVRAIPREDDPRFTPMG